MAKYFISAFLLLTVSNLLADTTCDPVLWQKSLDRLSLYEKEKIQVLNLFEFIPQKNQQIIFKFELSFFKAPELVKETQLHPNDCSSVPELIQHWIENHIQSHFINLKPQQQNLNSYTKSFYLQPSLFLAHNFEDRFFPGLNISAFEKVNNKLLVGAQLQYIGPTKIKEKNFQSFFISPVLKFRFIPKLYLQLEPGLEYLFNAQKNKIQPQLQLITQYYLAPIERKPWALGILVKPFSNPIVEVQEIQSLPPTGNTQENVIYSGKGPLLGVIISKIY